MIVRKSVVINIQYFLISIIQYISHENVGCRKLDKLLVLHSKFQFIQGKLTANFISHSQQIYFLLHFLGLAKLIMLKIKKSDATGSTNNCTIFLFMMTCLPELDDPPIEISETSLGAVYRSQLCSTSPCTDSDMQLSSTFLIPLQPHQKFCLYFQITVYPTHRTEYNLKFIILVLIINSLQNVIFHFYCYQFKFKINFEKDTQR